MTLFDADGFWRGRVMAVGAGATVSGMDSFLVWTPLPNLTLIGDALARAVAEVRAEMDRRGMAAKPRRYALADGYSRVLEDFDRAIDDLPDHQRRIFRKLLGNLEDQVSEERSDFGHWSASLLTPDLLDPISVLATDLRLGL